MTGPWKVTKNIPGLQDFLERVGIVADDGSKAPGHFYIPALSLAVQLDPVTGGITGAILGSPPGYGPQGLLVMRNVGNPAAGSDWSISVPDGERWRVHAVGMGITTDATAGNRAMSLIVKGVIGGTGPFQFGLFLCKQAILPSNGGQTISFIEGGQDGTEAVGTFPQITAPFGPLLLPPRFTIGTRTRGIGGADQISSIEVLYEKFSDPVFPNNGA